MWRRSKEELQKSTKGQAQSVKWPPRGCSGLELWAGQAWAEHPAGACSYDVQSENTATAKGITVLEDVEVLGRWSRKF